MTTRGGDGVLIPSMASLERESEEGMWYETCGPSPQAQSHGCPRNCERRALAPKPLIRKSFDDKRIGKAASCRDPRARKPAIHNESRAGRGASATVETALGFGAHAQRWSTPM